MDTEVTRSQNSELSYVEAIGNKLFIRQKGIEKLQERIKNVCSKLRKEIHLCVNESFSHKMEACCEKAEKNLDYEIVSKENFDV